MSKIQGNTPVDSILKDRVWDGVEQVDGSCRFSGLSWELSPKWEPRNSEYWSLLPGKRIPFCWGSAAPVPWLFLFQLDSCWSSFMTVRDPTSSQSWGWERKTVQAFVVC